MPDDAQLLSIANWDGRFYAECGDRRFVFDSEHGAGSVGNNANIRYMGFGVVMEAGTFLKLAADFTGGPERSSLTYLDKEAQSWGPPMLYVNVDRRTVTGHEGRHRSVLFARHCGMTGRLLVHIIPHGEHREVRARHVDERMLRDLRDGMFKQDSFTIINGPLFNFAFVGSAMHRFDR